MKKQAQKSKKSDLEKNKEKVNQKDRESHKFLFEMIGRIFRE
ncbi:hypothetical protein [Clostridium fermenticellae]|nr:hypothetical protein [Clostridium fermenticellae]